MLRRWLKEKWFIQRLFISGAVCGLVVGLAFSGVLNGSFAGSGVIVASSPSKASATMPMLPGQQQQGEAGSSGKKAPLPPLKKGDPLPANLFVELGKLLNPATVYISTTTMLRGRGGMMPRDPFFDFFRELNPDGGGFAPPAPRQAQSLGSGFIISSDGLIITNNHVVESADQIKVRVQTDDKNEKDYEATVIGTHKRTDLALIKIKPSQNLVVAQLGSSNDLEVGEWVAAFGNPLGLGHTLTKGIISAKNRAIDDLNRFPFIQTDASINPGNSGGPLVNTRGLVIGVNTAIAGGGAQGIGFAIPIDDAKPIVAQLQKTGSIQQGFLGVQMADLSPQAARYYGLSSLDGVLIVNVVPTGPAAKAGIRQEDVLTQFGEKKLKSAQDLSNAVSDAAVGSEVKVSFIRNGRERKTTVTVGESPGAPQRLTKKEARKQYLGQKAPFNLGFKMGELNEQAREDFGVDAEVAGPRPLVVEVSENSPAALGGLQVGDVILSVNQQDVRSSTDVIRKLKAGQNSLRIARQNMVALIFLSTKTE